MLELEICVVDSSGSGLDGSKTSTAATMIVSFTKDMAATALSISTVMLLKLPSLSCLVDSVRRIPAGRESPSLIARALARHVIPVSEAI